MISNLQKSCKNKNCTCEAQISFAQIYLLTFHLILSVMCVLKCVCVLSPSPQTHLFLSLPPAASTPVMAFYKTLLSTYQEEDNSLTTAVQLSNSIHLTLIEYLTAHIPIGRIVCSIAPFPLRCWIRSGSGNQLSCHVSLVFFNLDHFYSFVSDDRNSL